MSAASTTARSGAAVSKPDILFADIGGTNARFAIFADGRLGPVDRVAVADFADLAGALADFLERKGGGRRPDAALMGVAGTVEDNRCRIPNSRWSVDGAELQEQFGFAHARLLNDFEALAWSLPCLKGADLQSLGGGAAAAGAPALVVGPGTGFGAACLVPHGGTALVIATEAGHATMPSDDAQGDAILAMLRKRYGHVSVERILSGPGLENIHAALAAIGHAGAEKRDAAAITQAALAGDCELCRAAVDVFCAMLGAVAGNLALTFRARGGVYIGGGIVPRIARLMAQSSFRERFEAKGRYRGYLQSIPASIILRPDATFIGLEAYACAFDWPPRARRRPRAARKTTP